MSARRLVLFMDVNKTIVLFDNGSETSAAHNLLSHLGKSITHAWDSSVVESHFSYVRRVLAPGDEVADPALKKRRQSLDLGVLHRFPAVPGGVAFQARYNTMLLKLDDMVARERVILPSFQRLIAELRRQSHRVSVSIVLRSFGPDVSDAFNEIIETNPHLSVGTFGMFCKGQLHSLASMREVCTAYSASRVGPNRLPLADVLAPFPKADMFEATAALLPDRISVWSDDYSHWHSNGERAVAGKPFPVMSDPITVFFDDNAVEKEILAPVVSPHFSDDVAQRVVAVDPVLALECDDYFVNILQSRGILE